MMNFNGTETSQMGNPSLLSAIQQYRAGMSDFNAQTFDHNDEERQAYAAKSYEPPLEKLEGWCTAAESREAALAALQLVREEAEFISDSDLTIPLLNAAIAFFEREGGPA